MRVGRQTASCWVAARGAAAVCVFASQPGAMAGPSLVEPGLYIDGVDGLAHVAALGVTHVVVRAAAAVSPPPLVASARSAAYLRLPPRSF